MKEDKIIITGKEVGVAYCYATEIAYNDFTGEEFTSLFAAVDGGENNVKPKKILFAILSAIIAYAQAHGEEVAVNEDDLMYRATPQEIINAFSAVLDLAVKWYRISDGDSKAEKEGNGAKN